jgi:heme A synthase
MHRFDWVVLAVIVLGLCWYAWRHFRRARE